jgi:MtN3 and saliva related transmembrane protein
MMVFARISQGGIYYQLLQQSKKPQGEACMDAASIFGVIAGVFTSFRFVPQVYRSFTTKKTRDLSLAFLYFVSAQSLFLMLYGITRPDNYVLYMNIFPLICALFLIVMKLKYH